MTQIGRAAVADVLAQQSQPVHIHEIATRLGLTEGAYEALRRVLDDLCWDGSVVALAGQRFRLAKAARPTERHTEHIGILNANPRGFAFVSGAGLADDVFIPAEGLRGAMHGDMVAIRIVTRSRRGAEGEVLRIVKRKHTRVAGLVRKRGRSLWLEPDDTRIRGPIVLAKESMIRVEDGCAAVVTITRFPELHDENPEGVLEAVLGEPGDPNVEVAKILVRESIEEEHPAACIAEAQAYGTEVPEEALVGREDLTHLPLPTIDPEDARDHDDAVSVVRNDDGTYRVWVAIADVSHYVRPGTALDDNAMQRGNSIYLPDRAIPMLPRALSSHLCSLLPHVLRLCLCVEIDLDATAHVTKARLFEGFMRSRAKLTYGGVARALGLVKEGAKSEAAEAMREDLVVMYELTRLLRARRLRRGALDFDLPEAKVVLEPDTGAPIDVVKRAQDPGIKKAYQIVEELMLLANETVAQQLTSRTVPAIFRCHAPPDPTRLERFVAMCTVLDVAFEPEDASDPKRLATFLKRISVHPRKQVLHSLLLRAMKQAQYDVVNVGHFGLASSAYLHFTSPIRRYPDLIVHRAVRAMLRREPVDESDEAAERLRLAATTASDCERKGMEVEREVVDLYRALYMRSLTGSIHEGVVTGLVGSGVFVTLEHPFVDVMVRFESLGNDSYALDETGLYVVGGRSGERITFGDTMLVQIEDALVLRRLVVAKRVLRADDEEGAGEDDERARFASDKPKRRTKKTRSTVPDKPSRTARPEKSTTKTKTKTIKKQAGKPKKAR
ncbi:MAG: ribonuclease R [Polyangiaceae bacterium]|nr:ribonuclease R [Polyangiaceae bacterium]